MTDIIEEVESSVAVATDKKSFSIIDAIKGRSYPSMKVEVFLDEHSAFIASQLEEEISSTVDAAVDLTKLQEELESTLRTLEESKVTITVGGISEGDREDILNAALEKFPFEYEESKNPITGMVTKKEIDDPIRDKYFTNLIWQAQIKKIETASGEVQEGLSLEEIAEMRRSMPAAAINKINEAIDKVRIATLRFMQRVNEDFLAKR